MSKPETEEMGLTGPGVERRKIKPLEEAIDAWNSVKEKRMALTEKEVAAKEVVRQLMLKHDLEVYRYEETKEVVLTENVKVRKIDNGEGDND